MENNTNKNKILLYYKYVKIEDPEILRKEQYDLCKTLEIKGRIIVAKEGINGTLEGSEAFCNAYMNHMKADPRFSDIHWKISDGTPDKTAFPRLSVKARKEIVSLHLGENDFDPNETTGIHLKPEELHKWYEEGKEFHIVDMRNDYELLVGKFENTIFPGMRNFRDLRKDLKKIKELKDKPVLTVCTGGVRCEKASGFLIKEGFKEVYQLDGGIVSYMNQFPGKNFLGSLYVFDKRKIVNFNNKNNHNTIGVCRKCHKKTEQYVNCANLMCHRHFLCCDDCIDSDKVGKNDVILSYCGLWCKTKDSNNMSKVKILVLFTVFIDIIGIGVIIPTLPFYVESFGVSDTVVALLFSIYAFLSFLSAPFLGLISDRYGRRPVLIISILSSSIGWIVFAGAKNIWLLFLGRSIDGIAAGNISTAQSSLSDISKNSTERSANMGLIGAMFGIGLIIGPLIGGLLSAYGNTAPFWFVGILSLINTILAYFFLPETHKERTNTKIKINPISPIIDGFKNIEMRKIFLIFFLFGLAITIQQTIFGLYTARAFGFNSKTIGMVMGFIGLIILINQLFLLKNVWLKIWNNKILTKIMFFILSTGMIISSLKIIFLFFIGIILTTISQSNLRSTLMSIIAGQNKEKTGEYIGISTSIMSLSMILGPLLASAVYTINISIPFILAGIISLLCIPIYTNIIKKINI